MGEAEVVAQSLTVMDKSSTPTLRVSATFTSGPEQEQIKRLCTEQAPDRPCFPYMQVHHQIPCAVLVVDDEAILRMCAVDLLHDHGIQTLEADAAPQALALLKAHPEVEVLFTDINIFGDINGLALAHEVSRIRPDVRLVITSGRPEQAAAQMPVKSTFVSKPYHLEHVAELIEHLCATPN